MPTHPMLAMARTSGNPVIGNETVTFLWQGRTAPHLVDDLHNWDEDPQTMQRVGTELWAYSMPLAADAYLEYGFVDPKTGERLPDPLNQNSKWNGSNAYNHFFYMPQAGPSPLVKPLTGVTRGSLTHYQRPANENMSGGKRSVHLYQPAVKTPVPLLVVFDGGDYLKQGRLNVIADNLIGSKRVRPFAMALVNNGGAARTLEYSCSEATVDFLFETVIPLAQEHLILTPPGGEPYGVLGASLGGLMALYTGMRLPKVFGKVLSQSGAFIVYEHESVVLDLIRYTPPPDIQVWMDAGRYEFLLHGNRQVYAILKEKQYRVRYHEFSGGHNYTAWRNDIWRGLEALFRD